MASFPIGHGSAFKSVTKLIVLILVLIPFQNCENNSEIVTSLKNSGVSDFPENSQVPNPSVIDSTPLMNEEIPSDMENMPVVVDDTGSVSTTGTGIYPGIGSDDGLGFENEQSEELIKHCESLSKSSTKKNHVTATKDLSHLSGRVVYQIDHLNSVSHVKGRAEFVGSRSNSSIEIISNTSGTLILCNVSVKKISHFAGNIYLVDGDIDDIDGARGNLKIIRGRVRGAVTNSHLVIH